MLYSPSFFIRVNQFGHLRRAACSLQCTHTGGSPLPHQETRHGHVALQGITPTLQLCIDLQAGRKEIVRKLLLISVSQKKKSSKTTRTERIEMALSLKKS